jgi:hypothetical protein
VSSRKTPAGVAFAGFDRDATQFWHELAAHMSKEWFAANKPRYQSLWVEPMHALLRDIARGLARAYRPYALAEPGVLRIHRDLRFSRDKTPYKTAIAGIIRFAGDAVAGAGHRPAVPAPRRGRGVRRRGLLPVRRHPDRALAARRRRRPRGAPWRGSSPACAIVAITCAATNRTRACPRASPPITCGPSC